MVVDGQDEQRRLLAERHGSDFSVAELVGVRMRMSDLAIPFEAVVAGVRKQPFAALPDRTGLEAGPRREARHPARSSTWRCCRARRRGRNGGPRRTRSAHSRPAERLLSGRGAGSMIWLGYCDGVPYPDGSYWRHIQYGVPMIDHPGGLLSPGTQCVINPDGGPVPQPAPPGDCGGAA